MTHGRVFLSKGFHSFLLHLGNFGYIGAFIAGILFVSTFTVATSALVLLVLAETLSNILHLDKFHVFEVSFEVYKLFAEIEENFSCFQGEVLP